MSIIRERYEARGRLALARLVVTCVLAGLLLALYLLELLPRALAIILSITGYYTIVAGELHFRRTDLDFDGPSLSLPRKVYFHGLAYCVAGSLAIALPDLIWTWSVSPDLSDAPRYMMITGRIASYVIGGSLVQLGLVTMRNPCKWRINSRSFRGLASPDILNRPPPKGLVHYLNELLRAVPASTHEYWKAASRQWFMGMNVRIIYGGPKISNLADEVEYDWEFRVACFLIAQAKRLGSTSAVAPLPQLTSDDFHNIRIFLGSHSDMKSCYCPTNEMYERLTTIYRSDELARIVRATQLRMYSESKTTGTT